MHRRLINIAFDNFTQSFHLTFSQTEIEQLHTMLANDGHFQFEAPANDEQTRDRALLKFKGFRQVGVSKSGRATSL